MPLAADTTNPADPAMPATPAAPAPAETAQEAAAAPYASVEPPGSRYTVSTCSFMSDDELEEHLNSLPSPPDRILIGERSGNPVATVICFSSDVVKSGSFRVRSFAIDNAAGIESEVSEMTGKMVQMVQYRPRGRFDMVTFISVS